MVEVLHPRLSETQAKTLAECIAHLGLDAQARGMEVDGANVGWVVVVEVDRDTVAVDPTTGMVDWGPNWEFRSDQRADLMAVAEAVVRSKVTPAVWAARHG